MEVAAYWEARLALGERVRLEREALVGPHVINPEPFGPVPWVAARELLRGVAEPHMETLFQVTQRAADWHDLAKTAVCYNVAEVTVMQPELTIIYERDERRWWIATIPEVPGAFSQGRTRKQARENALDALRELMAARRELALRRRSPSSYTEPLHFAP